MTETPLGIYVHIPFCRRKCSYCDFLSWAECESDLERYASCLEDEIAGKSEWNEVLGARVASVYLGGGTPSLLTPGQIQTLLESIDRHFSLERACEITLEVNPESVTQALLEASWRSGVNRLSIGAQSFIPNTLKTLGRIHTLEQTLQAITTARQVGFGNISLDLIFGSPDETIGELNTSLEKVLQLRPEHLSTYSLTLEPETPLAKRISDGSVSQLDEDLTADEFQLVIETLKRAGYEHYEISNFALPGFQSRHNNNYWAAGFYLGLGCGAHSHLAHERFRNTESLQEYLQDSRLRLTRFEVETLDPEQRISEEMMLGLRRLKQGVNLSQMRERWGYARVQTVLDSLSEPIQNSLLVRREDNLFLTEKGVLLADEVLTCLV